MEENCYGCPNLEFLKKTNCYGEKGLYLVLKKHLKEGNFTKWRGGCESGVSDCLDNDYE